MNIPVEVIASFNSVGDIKPRFIRMEDEEHALHTYKIENVEYTKEQKYAGIRTLYFRCIICLEELQKQIDIYYNVETHKWMLEI